MSVRESDPVHRDQQVFADRLVGILDDSCLGLLLSVGHRTGLFDTMAGLPPSTAPELARAAGLHERPVREWLDGMVAGGIAAYDPAADRYTLPPEHAASLTRAAGTGNLAGLAPYLAMMGEIEQQVVESFRTGGGVPYSAYPRFRQLLAERCAQVHGTDLVETVIPLVPGLAERLRDGIEVLDLGCGQGRAVAVLARAFPASRFRGLDAAEGGIAAAREEAARLGLANTTFDVADSDQLDGHYDLVTAFGLVHGLARPARTLLAVRDALHDDGVFLMGDPALPYRPEAGAGHPPGSPLQGFTVFRRMTATPSAPGDDGVAAQRMLTEAGFTKVETHRVEGGILGLYHVARKG
ncbi:class I SAM-dependent methyltransferase [Peterkaempfera bronchialis]|uniref:Class I SAM-dependent methyltransferase n=1 Tax=Peterkaempfera bronchialis TaxID=2126346 RepID=A0A345SU29_9ACTN|nr:methyltransferase domain-containing protein [Peterkaempfera bronchialis]AXI77234.1 class I SAM-dependent methyltransferase [Peterkaempfera bronchialis]